MQSVQESKQELEASIRYAENAISSAKQTIESMEFRQEMAKKQHSEQTGREAALEREVAELRDIIDRMGDDITGDSVTIKQLNDRNDSLVATIQRLKKEHAQEIANLEECLKIETAALDRLREDTPTMPVIPKDVAIAIFREGVQSGVVDAISELEGQSITVSESGYTGDFEVSFERSVHLDDELDFDWMRDKVGQYNEEFVMGALKGLCALKEFECRIHGVDDQEEKKND